MTRPLVLALTGTAAVFVAMVSLQIHGYSISVWRAMIDASEATEILLGQTRSVRVDDFEVVLPLALAQTAHEPAFPVVNENIGSGLNMMLPFPMPVAHALAVFRPSTWGFFLGRDVGLAWLWWGRHVLTFLAWFLALRAVSRATVGEAVLGALLFAASPFVLFWCMRTTPAPMFGGLTLAAAVGWATAQRPARIVLAGIALGWAATAFVLTFYPPFQIPLAWLLGSLFLALLWERREKAELQRRARWRILGLAAALAVLVAALLALLSVAGDAIETLRTTDYPGSRVSLGGERTLWELFGTNLWLPLQVQDWSPLRNICESASFLILSPPLFLAYLASGSEGRSRLGPVEWTLFAALAAAILHATVGVPEWMARATGLGWVPSFRSVVVIGVADMLLAVRLMTGGGAVRVSRSVAWGAGLAWAAFLSWCAVELSRMAPGVSLALALPLALANGALVGLALARPRPRITLAIAIAGALAASVWFNPIVRGGSSYLWENPLSSRILDLDRDAGGDSVWIVFGDPRPANLIRVLGVGVINGVHPIPQDELWKELDPEGRWRETYNRFAHVRVHASPGPVRFEELAVNVIQLSIAPDARALRQLGVTHAVVTQAPKPLFEQAGWQYRGSVGRFRLFAIGQPGGDVSGAGEGAAPRVPARALAPAR